MAKHLLINIIKALYLFTIASAAFLLTTKLNAQSIEPEYKFLLDLKEGSGSIGKLVLNLKGGNELDVVDKYEITIPIKNAQNFIVTTNEKVENNISITDNGGYKTISIIFETPLPTSSSTQLTIQFTSPELLINQYGLKHIYIQNPFDNSSKAIKYEIKYPKSFGNIYRTYKLQKISELDYKTNLMEVESNNGIYILWADNVKVNIKTNVSVRNEDSGSNRFFFNLPSPSLNQKVFFHDITGIDDGFSDMFNNLLGDITLDPNSEKNVGYSADVFMNNNESLQIYPDRYKFLLNTGSSFVQDVMNNTKDISSNYLKFQVFNQMLREQVSPNKQASININNLENVWNRLDSRGTINSFEYSALNIMFAEYLNLYGRIDYGYIISSPVEMDLSRPQTWAVINIDGKNVLVDSFMEDLSSISYFDINYVDRVKFGTWHPSQTYNPAAGLAYELNTIKVDLNTVESQEYRETFTVDFKYPESVASGVFFQGEILIKNDSQMPLVLKSLLINNIDSTVMINHSSALYPVVLPNKEKKLIIENLKEDNFFTNQTKMIEAKLNFEGIDTDSIDRDSITFYIDIKNIILFIIIFGLSMTALGYLFIKVKKHIFSK